MSEIVKISGLPEVTSPIASDVLPIVTGGETKKVQVGNLPVSTATQTAIDATKPIVVSISLPMASWTGDISPYTQIITITGSTANSIIDIRPDAAALAQMSEDGTNAIYIENNNNTLTAYAVGDKPTVDLTL